MRPEAGQSGCRGGGWKASTWVWAFIRGSALGWGSAGIHRRQAFPCRQASWMGRSKPVSPGWSGPEGCAQNLPERPEQTLGWVVGAGRGEEAASGILVPGGLRTRAFVGYGSKFCNQILMPHSC